MWLTGCLDLRWGWERSQTCKYSSWCFTREHRRCWWNLKKGTDGDWLLPGGWRVRKPPVSKRLLVLNRLRNATFGLKCVIFGLHLVFFPLTGHANLQMSVIPLERCFLHLKKTKLNLPDVIFCVLWWLNVMIESSQLSERRTTPPSFTISCRSVCVTHSCHYLTRWSLTRQSFCSSHQCVYFLTTQHWNYSSHSVQRKHL